MVTKSSSTNLLSRFALLFREPGSADDDSDSRQSGPTVASTSPEPSMRQLLRRKVRNDAIRAMELNHLRSILQDGQCIKHAKSYDSATPSQMMRSSILDKIDGAEAHLDQWWGTATTQAPVTPAAASTPLARAAPSPMPDSAPASFSEDMDLDFTGLGALTGPEPTPPEPAIQRTPSAPPALPALPALPTRPTPPEPPCTAPPVLMDVAYTALDVCMRDAAQHYADGDFGAAYKLLSDMLRDPALEPHAAESLTFALFDVCRCAGQQSRFEALALNYAKRFGRSPGEWFSLSDSTETGKAADSRHAEPSQEPTWRCPSTLDTQALAECISRNPATASRSYINWEALQHIDVSIAPELAAHIKIWCAHPVDLHWTGLDALIACVQQCKNSDDVTRSATWWLIHLDLLCIQQQAGAFEDMALDYCVAFEVSPPDWKPAQCHLVQATDFRATTGFAATKPYRDFEESVASRSPYTLCEIQGHLTGEATEALHTLHAASRNVGQVTVSCSRLGRVDFDAASALISWASLASVQGCHVQFVHLPRLVLVFLDMLGMAKVATLS